jgi:hypothetical protein
VVRTQTEDKTIEIQAFQGFPLLPAISNGDRPLIEHMVYLLQNLSLDR